MANNEVLSINEPSIQEWLKNNSNDYINTQKGIYYSYDEVCRLLIEFSKNNNIVVITAVQQEQ